MQRPRLLLNMSILRSDGSQYGRYERGRRYMCCYCCCPEIVFKYWHSQRLREINVREEDLHQLAIDAFNDVCTGGNPRPTSVEDIEALYHKAF